MVSRRFYICWTAMTLLFLTFCIASLLHLLDILLRLIPLLKRQSTKSKKTQEGFTVVICAHNELKNLKKNMAPILAQTYPNFEVIVVLDRSDDGSYEYLEPIFQSNPTLRVLTVNHVPENIHPKKYGITKAIELANHPWILLTDADCHPTSFHWIQSFNDQINPQTEIILGLSPYARKSGFVSQITDYETLHTAWNYISSTLRGSTYMAVGRNLAYKKALFVEGAGYGQYVHLLGGDDDLFVQRHAKSDNVSVNLSPESHTYSDPEKNWRAYFRQKLRHFSVGKYYHPIFKIKLSMQAFIHTVMWVSFLFLISFKPSQLTILLAFALVLITKGLITKIAASKLKMNSNPILMPVLDLVFAVLFPLISLASLLIKKVRWN